LPLSVADVLALDIMRDARVLAGAAHLTSRHVNWVSVMEMPVEKFVRPGEFILTTGIGCGHDEALFGAYITEIMDSEAAAAAISVGKFVDRVPASVIQSAEARGFPLIEIPWELPFASITQAALESIISQQNAVLRRSAAVRRQLLDAILAGQGVEAIVKALSGIVGRPVAVLDTEFRPLAAEGHLPGPTLSASAPDPAGPEAETLPLEIWNRDGTARLTPSDLVRSVPPGAPPARVSAEEGPAASPVLAAGIWAGRELFGYVLVFVTGVETGLEELESFAIEHAATSAAVFFLKARAITQTEMRLKGDFVWTLASGADDISASAQARAKFLRYDIGRSYRALLFDIDNFRSYLRGIGIAEESEVQRVKDQVQRIIEAAAAAGGRRVMVTNQQDSYICFLEAVGDEGPEEAAAQFAARVQGSAARACSGLTLSCGVGRVHQGPDRLARSYHEAAKALRVGKAMKGRGSFTPYERLGALGLLIKLGEDEEAIGFVAEHLGPLLDQDQKRGSSLLDTLRAFAESSWNASRAARSLHLHRQSFLYRLGRIEELTGLSLSDASDRFALELCLNLHRIIGGEPEPKTLRPGG